MLATRTLQRLKCSHIKVCPKLLIQSKTEYPFKPLPGENTQKGSQTQTRSLQLGIKRKKSWTNHANLHCV
jgi:hypothetical protein